MPQANVLNAVGGAPGIDQPTFIPSYPLQIPIINISISIEPLTKNSLLTFATVESPPSSHKSISETYSYIAKLLTALCSKFGEHAVFTGHPTLQVSKHPWSWDVCIDVCMDMCVDMCVDMCMDKNVCMDMRTDTCTILCTKMCMDV